MLSKMIIELFTEVPNRITRAIMLFMFRDCRKTRRDKKAPVKAGGRARSIKSGIEKDSN